MICGYPLIILEINVDANVSTIFTLWYLHTSVMHEVLMLQTVDGCHCFVVVVAEYRTKNIFSHWSLMMRSGL